MCCYACQYNGICKNTRCCPSCKWWDFCKDKLNKKIGNPFDEKVIPVYRDPGIYNADWFK